MDSGILILLVLVSLGLVVGALVALWWRSSRGNSDINERLGSAPAPVAPARQREKPTEADRKEQAPPPPAQAPSFGGLPGASSGVEPPTPAAPSPVIPRPATVPPPPPPAPAVPLQPQAPAGATPSFSIPPVSKPPVAGAVPPIAEPAPAEEEFDPSARGGDSDDDEDGPMLEKAADEKPDTAKRRSQAEEAAPAPVQPAPLTPSGGLHFGDMPPELLDDFINEVAAKPDLDEDTRSGEATTTVEAVSGAAQSVLFSAYYPKEVVPEAWEKLHAYIFRAQASAAVEADAHKQLGPRMAEFRGVRAPSTTDVPEGALVTATPHMDGFQFNPPSVSLGFYKDWHRFDFEVRAKGAPLNQSTNGLLTFSVEGIIVADVPLSIYVGETVSATSGQANAVARLYQAIFCSYSHQDQQVVARAERAYKALGLDYLRDVISLKSGQEWNDELRNLINKADIFQLFWSHTAAESEHVRSEWEHALQVAGWRANFIRPVYWEDPKPPIPTELKHIHFAYQPDLGK